MPAKSLPPRSGRESLALALLSVVFSLSLIGSVLALFMAPVEPLDRVLAVARPASSASAPG